MVRRRIRLLGSRRPFDGMVGCGLLVAGVLALAPGTAAAGTFDVVACNAAPGAVNNSWVPDTSTGADRYGVPYGGNAGYRCPTTTTPSGGMALSLSSMATATAARTGIGVLATPGTAAGDWTFTAPAGTVIVGFRGDRHYNAPTAYFSQGLTALGGTAAWSDTAGSSTSSGASFTTISTTAIPRATALQLYLRCLSNVSLCQSFSSPSVRLGGALAVTLSDEQAASVTVTGGSLTDGAWKRGPHPVTFDAADNTGIQRSALVVDGVEHAVETHGCDFTRAVPCSNLTGHVKNVNTANLPHGSRDAVIRVYDAGNRPSDSAPFPLRTDNIGPVLDQGGELYDSAHSHLTGHVYGYWIDSVDGDEAGVRQSGVRRLEIFVDDVSQSTRGGLLEQTCATDSCDGELDWDFRRTDFTVGSHTIRVIGTDFAGNTSTASFPVYLSSVITPLPPDSESPGTMSAAGAQTASRFGFGPGCESRLGAALRSPGATRIIRGRRRGRAETTVRYGDGGYSVASCDRKGRFIELQEVRPVETPGGLQLLPIAVSKPTGRRGEYLTTYLSYRSPHDPRFIAGWKENASDSLAAVHPPTPIAPGP